MNYITRRKVIKALGELRRIVLHRRKSVILDFSRTQKLYAEGTLLFVAELRRMLRLSGGNVAISGTVPCVDKVAQVLKKLGVLDLLGVECDVVPKDEDVIHWRHAHGHKVDGAAYEDVLAEYDGEIAEALSQQLYTGITEAMTNVLNHAYEFPREDGTKTARGEWWMFSQEKDGMLSVAFCDLGAGIPPTLRLKRPSVWARAFRYGDGKDANVIAHAIQDSVSRTRQGHRGHGLNQIVSLVDNIRGGRVQVISNRGAIEREAGNMKPFEFSDSIMGTLIYWLIPLHSKEAV
ncbi:hypothetical protein [Cupriavidus sp. amp6]|uniref:hypothetical protein n=1 Tax=Cupriavidus sp. amp6 TaxID=388051 RepID=UPI00048BB2ED|nr:hypothetical protein [Cupriavidus sp. amp6]